MKRLCLIMLLVLPGAKAGEIIPLTRDVGDNPDYVTYEEWCAAHPEAGTRSQGPTVAYGSEHNVLYATEELIAVVVAENVNAELDADLDQYVADLENRGYSVERSTYSSAGTAEDLKDYFGGKLPEGLVGAVLVGELPFAWYQVANDGDANGMFTGLPVDFTEEFPCDLFLCDLDGVWADDSTFNGMENPLSPGSDGRYDSHSGDREPEIWVSRIDGSRISLVNSTELYHSYFDRVHSYKQAELTYPSQGLFYVDDDWVDYFPDHNTGAVCDTLTEERDKLTTCPDDYSDRLPQDGLYLTILVHSDPVSHYFTMGAPAPYYMFYNTDLIDADPCYGFYNLFACSNARWIEDDCMGVLYQMTGKGLAVIGSTKSGSMLEFSVFNTALGEGKTWGEAWIELTEYWMDYYPQFPYYDQYSRGWYMGMCLFGDGSLDLGEQTPVQVIEENPACELELLVDAVLAGSAEIRFSLPRALQVRLEIFDASGRLVEEIFSGNLDAGNHAMTWRSKNAPAGVYFVRLTGPTLSAGTRFIITR